MPQIVPGIKKNRPVQGRFRICDLCHPGISMNPDQPLAYFHVPEGRNTHDFQRLFIVLFLAF
jgi:hypothetical protein